MPDSSAASLRSSPLRSVASRLPSRELLFGEIDSTAFRALRPGTSICNLTLSSSATFLRFWLNDNARETVLDFLPVDELCKLRLVCHDFSGKIATRIFRDLDVTFRSSTFSRPSRIAALERIGTHVRSLAITFPQDSECPLPPLIDPITGDEIPFTYNPLGNPLSSTSFSSTSSAATATSTTTTASLSRAPDTNPGQPHSHFGSSDVAQLLIKQYPPIFHAATNVNAFVKAFSALPLLLKLKISCNGQSGRSHGQRSVADYALISLRMAVERAQLDHLEALSFLPIHPAGLFYMQPLMGYGANPRSMRRWAQIRKMEVHMESHEADPAVKSDHLKTLHTYLRNFANSLVSFQFRWKGAKGPSPVSLATEPCFCADERKGTTNQLRAIRFTALNHMELENAVMDAAQISAFICEHKRTLTEFKFEQVKLRTGDWDEALQPLAEMGRRRRRNKATQSASSETMEVPIMLSRSDFERHQHQQHLPPLPPPPPEGEIVHESFADQQAELEQLKSPTSPFNICRFLSKATQRRAAKASQRAREHLAGGSEQVKRMFRASLLGNR